MGFPHILKKIFSFVIILTVSATLFAESSFAVRKEAPHGKKKSATKSALKSARPARHLASTPKAAKKKSVAKKFSAKKKALKHAKSKHAQKRKVPLHSKSKKMKFPTARETPHERDMPFVSVPARRVKRVDRTVVMEDPAIRHPLAKPRLANKPSLRPDGDVLDPEGDEAPSEVGAAKAILAPGVVGPAPASVEPELSPESAAAQEANREPDAFDLHSGSDPMRGP